MTIKPDAKTGAHHHGHLESIIDVARGRARMRWGERLQFVAEAGPGDFIFVPPYVPHREINASADEVLECVLVRSDGEAIAVNLDIEPSGEAGDRAMGRSDPSRRRGVASIEGAQARRSVEEGKSITLTAPDKMGFAPLNPSLLPCLRLASRGFIDQSDAAIDFSDEAATRANLSQCRRDVNFL